MPEDKCYLIRRQDFSVIGFKPCSDEDAGDLIRDAHNTGFLIDRVSAEDAKAAFRMGRVFSDESPPVADHQKTPPPDREQRYAVTRFDLDTTGLWYVMRGDKRFCTTLFEQDAREIADAMNSMPQSEK